ncbi:hypothetical protein Tco_1462054, partial [Tanacetum coccineum]
SIYEMTVSRYCSLLTCMSPTLPIGVQKVESKKDKTRTQADDVPSAPLTSVTVTLPGLLRGTKSGLLRESKPGLLQASKPGLRQDSKPKGHSISTYKHGLSCTRHHHHTILRSPSKPSRAHICIISDAIRQSHSICAAFLATLHPSHQLVTLVAAFTAACTLCGSLRSSLQPIWQPSQQPELLWQPLQQSATYVAAFAAACNLCGRLHNSLHHMWHPPQQIESSVAAFIIAYNLCGILHSSMQPL